MVILVVMAVVVMNASIKFCSILRLISYHSLDLCEIYVFSLYTWLYLCSEMNDDDLDFVGLIKNFLNLSFVAVSKKLKNIKRHIINHSCEFTLGFLNGIII